MLKQINKIPGSNGPIASYGCSANDTCYYCDTKDLCAACDVMDMCIWTDT